MKRLLATMGLVLALGLGFASAQNITKSLQGSQDPRGPVGQDTSNAMYFPGHINAFGQMTTSPSPATCGSGQEIGVVTSNSTDVAGVVVPQSTACQIFFGSPFNSTPICVTQAQSLAGASVNTLTITVASTGFNLTSTISGGSYNYVCLGNK